MYNVLAIRFKLVSLAADLSHPSYRKLSKIQKVPGALQHALCRKYSELLIVTGVKIRTGQGSVKIRVSITLYILRSQSSFKCLVESDYHFPSHTVYVSVHIRAMKSISQQNIGHKSDLVPAADLVKQIPIGRR